jgi:hypothetical protein
LDGEGGHRRRGEGRIVSGPAISIDHLDDQHGRDRANQDQQSSGGLHCAETLATTHRKS